MNETRCPFDDSHLLEAVELSALRLLQDGVVALARVEHDGVRVDVDYLKASLEQTSRKCTRLREQLMSDPVWSKWTRRFRDRSKLDSRQQLGEVLFDVLGFHSEAITTTGRHQVDEAALERVDHPFIRHYLELAKLEKARGTYLKGIEREVVYGFVHCSFNLHTVTTYRGSCDSPNLQNIPIRNPEIGKLVRRCFIARDGHVLVENDFKGIEVGVAACYNRDPNLIAYVRDETLDMHRDAAMELFFLDRSEVTKQIRHIAKNSFVFPQFYGDWYLSCARSMVDEIEKRAIKFAGRSFKKHLARHGIMSMGAMRSGTDPVAGSFEQHVARVERLFWEKRFRVYNQWRNRVYRRYLEDGYFDTHTGFRLEGALDRKQVVNHPIQGSAFHCLLWSLIEIQRELVQHKMRSKIVLQVHDSILGDVHVDEVDQYLAIVRDVIERRLRKHWKWIVVPLRVECEMSPVGGSWFDKREVHVSSDNYAWNDFSGSASDLLRHWTHETKVETEEDPER
jgi:DNA polymerase-1